VNWKNLSLHNRFYLSAATILIAGILVGATLYFFATSTDASGANIVIVGGKAYSVDPAESKSYDDQLQRMGGRSLVRADEFNRWFGSLWQGENLGLTIAVLATILALILLWIGHEVERVDEHRRRSQSDSS
jgi:hypothetical protein